MGAARDGASSARVPEQRAFGERPPAPWHPLPVSEVMILLGGVAAAVGMGRRSAGVPPLLLVGIAVASLGALEVAWREHRSGYRSHTMLLAFLPVVVFHSAVVLLVIAFTRLPPMLNLGLLALDAALFLTLFKLLRARFQQARARVLARQR